MVLLDAFMNAMLASSALGLLVRKANHATTVVSATDPEAVAADEGSRSSNILAALKSQPLRPEVLIVSSLVLAYFLNPGENAEEYLSQTIIAWACYLDAAAMAPQLWHLLKTKDDGMKGNDEGSPALPGFATGLLLSKLCNACFWAHMFYIDNMRCFYCLFAADCLGLAISFAICGLGVVRPWLVQNQSSEGRGFLLDTGGTLEPFVPLQLP